MPETQAEKISLKKLQDIDLKQQKLLSTRSPQALRAQKHEITTKRQ